MTSKLGRVLFEQRGMSLIELLIGVFVLATLTMAVVGLATLGTKTAFNNELLAQAQAIANEKAEIIRALPYDSVGYTEPADCANKEANGITYNYCEPDGIIQRTEDVIRDNVTYTVTTIISLVDDQENGYLTKNTAPVLPMSVAHAQSTPTLDETTADYKQGEVAVSIPSTKATQQTVQVGWISADDALACADSSDCPGVDVCCSEQCVEPCLDENLPDGWTCSSECDSGWSGFGDPVPNIQPPGGGGGGGAGQICQVSVARNNCQVIAWLPDVVNPQFCVPHVIGRDPDPSCGSAWCDFGDGIPNCGYPVETSVNIDTCNLGADSNDPCGGAAGSCLEGEVCKLKKGFIGHVCVKDPRRNCAWCGAEPWTSYDQNDAEVNTPASERVTCCYSQDRGVVTSGIPQPPLINEYSYRPCRAEGEPCRKTEDSFTWGECQWARARGAAGCKYMECGPANNINPNPLAVQRLCPGNQPTMDDNININQSSTVIGSEEEEMPVEIYKIDPAAEGLEEGDTIHIKAECDSPLGAGMTGDSVLGFHRNWWNKARGFLGAMLPWVNAQSLCSVGLDVFVASENDLENTLGTSPPHIRSRGAGSDTLDYTVEAEAMAGDAVIVVLAYPASPDIYSLMQTGGGEFDLSGSIAAYVDRTDCEPPPSEAPSNAICNLDGITSLNVSINDVLDGYSSVEKCSNNMSYETTCNLFNVSSVAVNLVSQTEDYMTFESAPFTVPCGSLTPGDDSYYIKVTATEYAYPGGNQCLFDTYIFGRMFNNGNVEIMGTVYNVPEGSEPTYLPLVVGDDELGWAGDSSNNCQFFHTTDYKNAVLTLDR